MEEIKQSDVMGLQITKTRKRKFKKGELSYPEYDFKTMEEVFNSLTPENMNRFFKAFKQGMSAMVHMRELLVIVAKEEAKKDGVELPLDALKDCVQMTSFKWIDD